MSNRYEELKQFLSAPERPPRTMDLAMLNGFLFAMACSPELIQPSEWIPQIFDEAAANYADEDEAVAVLQSIMDLYNAINLQVASGVIDLPQECRPLKPAIDNLAEDAPLAHWSRGFLSGHDWLLALWDECLPEPLEEELGSCLLMLSFFADRNLAESYCREATKKAISLVEMAETAVEIFPQAMASYAHIGRSINGALHESERAPYVQQQAKVGRNDPCPCGSGKKFKHCCLH